MALPSAFVNTGRPMGDGRLHRLNSLADEGTLAPGSFGTGMLTVSMSTSGPTLFQTDGSVFEVGLASMAAFDLLAIEGSVAPGGALALSCPGACSLAVGDRLTILDATGSLNGSFSSVTLSGFGSGAFDVVDDLVGASVQLGVTQAVTAVPEPGSRALMLGGLGALAALARRRRSLR